MINYLVVTAAFYGAETMYWAPNGTISVHYLITISSALRDEEAGR